MFPVSDVIPSRRTPVVTIGLIVLNSLVFLYELRLDPREMDVLARSFGVVPEDPSLRGLLATTFLHDGWIHVVGNMLYLWIFGDNVEDALGHAGFLLFYVGAGAAAALAHTALNPGSSVPLIGASGAVAAVMGAYFVLYPRSKVLTAIFLVLYMDIVEVPAIFFLGMWLILQLLVGLTSMGTAAAGGVAFGAHLAGFCLGLLIGLAFRKRVRRWEAEPTR
jgi:membrane associated rhomboid family serine protease